MSATLNAEMLQRIAEAEAAVAALADEYLDYARADVAEINSGITTLAETVKAGGETKPHVARVFAVAHNIKGQAASFGFPLLTDVAASICGHTRHADGADMRMADALVMHGEALSQILEGNLRDDGGAAGAALIARLAPVMARED